MSAVASWANSVNVGYVYLQQDDTTGLVTFNVVNATGSSGESYPEFPVLDNLDLTAVSLTVQCANAACMTNVTNNQMSLMPLTSETFDLGALSSGGTNTAVSFNSADTFSSATLTVSFSTINLNIDNGTGIVGSTPFTGSASSTLAFNPGNGGQVLTPWDITSDPFGANYFDVGIIVDPQGNSGPQVPEPGTLCLLASGMGSLVLRRRFKRDS